MENAGSMIEGGEWSSFSGVYGHEEADFMAQLFPNCSATNDPDGGSSLALGPPCWTSHESNYNMAGAENGSIYSSNTSNSNLYSFPHSSSYSGGSSVVYPTGGHESYYLSDTHQFLESNNSSVSIDLLLSDPKNHAPVHDFTDDRVDSGDYCLNLEMSSSILEDSGPCLTESEISGKHLMLKRDSDISELDSATEEKTSNDSSNNSRKLPRASDVQKGKRNVKSKKNQKLTLDISTEEDNNIGVNRHISGACSSEDESNASQDPTEGASSCLSSKGAGAGNSSGKTRASRGSATDPQSLYARKRRERINERLRILQNLVPNGTKVDISTMLEEAVHYVKFLQLQIKLLSSDDTWMYAPLAYNGMDLGLDLNMSIRR